MSLPTKNLQSVAPVLGAILLGWIVELFSLYYLQKSARLHNTPAWAAGAGFPAEAKPWKLYRFQWLTVWCVVDLGRFPCPFLMHSILLRFTIAAGSSS